MNFLWRLRLFIGGELIRLGGSITPSVEGDWGNSGCDERADWVIYGKNFDDVTYSCTDHLPDMITVETVRIERQGPPTLNALGQTCCYIYSTNNPGEIAALEKLTE